MTDVVVAGGGIIGMTVAWRLAQQGLSVAVVDHDAGGGASYAAAGMLAPVTEVAYGEAALLDLARASLDLYPAFLAELTQASSLPVALRSAGTLMVGFDEDDVVALVRSHDFQAELGLDAHRVGPQECRRLEPSLTTRLRAGVHVTGDHSVDARGLHAALTAAARNAGVQLVARRVADVLLAGGRVAGVVCDDGSALTGGHVVLAMGAWSRGLPSLPADAVPVRPVKGQILRLGGEALLRGTVRALVRGRSVYLVPLGDAGLVVGATVEELGFDPRVTAGAVHELLRDAIEVVPGVSELELVETLARWRPGTPDNAPLLGPTCLAGLVLATGHHRNGVLLAPVTAAIIADLLLTGVLPPLARPFGADRFTGGGHATPAVRR